MKPEIFFLTSMPPTRPADYCLGYMDSSVFIDFNNLDDGRVYLVRISFDSYGCCRLGDKSVPLSTEDSAVFKQIIRNNLQPQDKLLELVKHAIQLNAKIVWQDAIEEYHLT